MISTVKRVGNGETDEGRALTCDIQLNSEMSSGWILEIHSAAIDAVVSQRCPVDNQVTFAGDLTVKRETKVGSQSKRNYLGPSSTHWQWLAASIEPVLNDNKAQGDGYFIWFCLSFSISVMNSTQQKKKTKWERIPRLGCYGDLLQISAESESGRILCMFCFRNILLTYRSASCWVPGTRQQGKWHRPMTADSYRMAG